ncbi:MAG: hypothetical protein ABW153_09890 [Sedimenticola sp.]
MNIKVIFLVLLFSILSAGCQTTMIREDLARVKPDQAETIAKDWAAMIAGRYPAKSVFQINGQGEIGKALSDALRSRGFGLATVQQGETGSIPIEVRTDNFDVDGVLVSLVVEREIISRSYSIKTAHTEPNSRFTRLLNEGE